MTTPYYNTITLVRASVEQWLAYQAKKLGDHDF